MPRINNFNDNCSSIPSPVLLYPLNWKLNISSKGDNRGRLCESGSPLSVPDLTLLHLCEPHSHRSVFVVISAAAHQPTKFTVLIIITSRGHHRPPPPSGKCGGVFCFHLSGFPCASSRPLGLDSSKSFFRGRASKNVCKDHLSGRGNSTNVACGRGVWRRACEYRAPLDWGYAHET